MEKKMHKNPNLFTAFLNLKRPKLLMSAASELARRRKFLGKDYKAFDTEKIKALIEKEAELEAHRTQNAPSYPIDEHIEILAIMIEQARLIADLQQEAM